MAHVIDFTLPPTGEMGDSARLVSWLVEPGQTFERDEVLLEIETDKSVIEIPAPQKGKVLELLAKVDAVIELDTPLVRLELEGDGPAVEKKSDSAVIEAIAEPVEAVASPPSPPPVQPVSVEATRTQADPGTGRLLATPAARSAMQADGLDPRQLEGSGPGGRITLADVARAPAKGKSAAHGAKSTIQTEMVATRFGPMCL